MSEYLRRRMSLAQKMGLWCCPKCGIIGRHMHRFMAPHPKPAGLREVGECNLYVLERAGHPEFFTSGAGI